MRTHLYLAILWAGSRIVPEGARAEWRAEWQTELWYAMQEDRGGRLMGYCLGSLRDALWQRKNAGIDRCYGSVLRIADRPAFPEPPAIPCAHPLESPFRCLALLGVLASIAVSAALFAPQQPVAGGTLFLTLLPLCALLGPVVILTSGTALGEYPQHRNWLRRGCFYVAKMTLLLLAAAFGASALTRTPAQINIALAGTFFAIRWAIMDQRRRCPTCLRILDKPVRMGSRSRILLEWSGTELLCLRGHGVMHIPETPAIWFTKPRWMSLG